MVYTEKILKVNLMFQLVAIKPLICDEENLKLVSKVLENVEVCCHGFDDSLKNIKTGDFVYLDLYIPTTPHLY